MASDQQGINLPILTEAWHDYEHSKNACEHPQAFVYGEDIVELVPEQVDTEITLNLSGTEVCDVENLIPKYEVATLPYTNGTRLSEMSFGSGDINCVDSVMDFARNGNCDGDDVPQVDFLTNLDEIAANLPDPECDIDCEPNSLYNENFSPITEKVSTETNARRKFKQSFGSTDLNFNPILNISSEDIDQKVSVDSHSYSSNISSTPVAKNCPQNIFQSEMKDLENYSEIAAKDSGVSDIVLDASNGDNKYSDLKMLTIRNDSAKVLNTDKMAHANETMDCKIQKENELSSLAAGSHGTRSDLTPFQIASVHFSTSANELASTADLSGIGKASTVSRYTSNEIQSTELNTLLSNSAVKATEKPTADVLTNRFQYNTNNIQIKKELATLSEQAALVVTDSPTVGTSSVILDTQNQIRPVAAVLPLNSLSKLVCVNDQGEDKAVDKVKSDGKHIPVSRIKSSIPTGKLMKVVSNFKSSTINPIYTFGKVSINNLSLQKNCGTTSCHQIKQLPSSNSNSIPKIGTEVKTSQNTFNLLKSVEQQKVMAVGQRIVVPVDHGMKKTVPGVKLATNGKNSFSMKTSTTALTSHHYPCNRAPVVVTIKKNTGGVLSNQTLKQTAGNSSGSVIHRIPQINILNKNPKIIKCSSPLSNNGSSTLSIRSLQSFSSPVHSKNIIKSSNLPIVRNIPGKLVRIITNNGTKNHNLSMNTKQVKMDGKRWTVKQEIKSENVEMQSPIHNIRTINLNLATNTSNQDIKNIQFSQSNGGLNFSKSRNTYQNRIATPRLPQPPPQTFDVFDELTNLDWLKDEDKSLHREIRKLNPDDPGIGLSSDDSDHDSRNRSRNSKSIFTAYSKVYGPNYYGTSRAQTEYEYNPNSKPPYSFSLLIFMAIEDSDAKKLPVKEIYTWVCKHFPYFKTAPPGWKNSIRHNLSLSRTFDKAGGTGKGKSNNGKAAKGALWIIDPAYRANQVQALQRSAYYPYLHPPSFKSTEPLNNLADLLPMVQRIPKKTETEDQDLWADPDLRNAAINLIQLSGIAKSSTSNPANDAGSVDENNVFNR